MLANHDNYTKILSMISLLDLNVVSYDVLQIYSGSESNGLIGITCMKTSHYP